MDLDFLYRSFTEIFSGENWKMIVMWVIGFILIYLAIKKQLEPALLLPMGFGAILINLPFSGAIDQVLAGVLPAPGVIEWMYNVGIEASEAMPLLLFIGIGAMIDFGPLLSNPKLLFFGAAAQFGIFATVVLAVLCGFNIADAASAGIIAAADGPTSIMVGNLLKTQYLAAVIVVAYSYMALVPIIQPFAIKLVTTKKERLIRMPYNPQRVTKASKIIFPIAVTIIAGLIAPASIALVGMLMFGNLLRECGVLDMLSDVAQKTLANLVTLLLGITVAFSMKATEFIRIETLMIMGFGLFGFVMDSIGGVLFAKLINLFLPKGKKINPMVGAAGISAFPMSSRVVQKLGIEADPSNHLLMHAVSANVSGQIGSVVAGGVVLALVPLMLVGA
ncbi:MAG: sodium ion-translocating decarboxylase subunit beta [Christensenellaceae bacterium]|jgi:oxaloacetate decarboxylase beta subunit|nr:sodium ion-translocating decarboxylase subunit beta [Christensenellaceae bacterium]